MWITREQDPFFQLPTSDMELKIPIKAKIYEALGAIGDDRVELIGRTEAKVTSSGRDRSYVVRWSEDLRSFNSNDNATRWQGTIGYPIIAVLLKLNVIGSDPAVTSALSGIPWKLLNDKARRDYDRVIEEVLRSLEAKGIDRSRLQAEVDRIHGELSRSGINKLSKAE